ncbi:hypothetical protein Ait01nite_070150 [Actinoplanes italicus]|uniref:Uncharacterized protein n=1 Tax=Actinoplanes italicus TaxID=113567 RepID=A0A2T0JUZ6_9ACTN|nr:hypothetical protein [Actinoplanes italicus]PRX11501.1 hypothetical protein CLV67_13177 [Actinoplanes italicus]GIE33970.1 hypothetical protein Ait01nite_070150 [Actinoplanes italicus]
MTGVLIALAASVAVASPAAAAEGTVVQGKVDRYDRSALRPAETATGDLRQRMSAARTAFVQDNARRGSNVDTRAVETFTDPSARVIVAAGNGEVVDGIDIGTADGYLAGVGIRSHEGNTTTTTAAAPPVIGFAGEPDPTGYQRAASGSHVVTVGDDPDLAIPGGSLVNHVKSWYWKYSLAESKESDVFTASERSGSDFWVYARRGDADGRTSDLQGAALVDLTIRSRPWGGTSGNFKQLQSRVPFGAAPNCVSGGNLEISFGVYKVVMPQSSCQTVKGATNVSSYEFGADWDGSTFNLTTIEAMAAYKVKEGYTPSFADYIWASFNIGPMGRKDVKWTDTGW